MIVFVGCLNWPEKRKKNIFNFCRKTWYFYLKVVLTHAGSIWLSYGPMSSNVLVWLPMKIINQNNLKGVICNFYAIILNWYLNSMDS